MLYLRLSIGVIFILLCTKIGKNKANKYKFSCSFYESLLSFCNLFKSNLLYKKSSLEDFLNFNYSSVDFKNLLNYYVINQEILEYPVYLSDEEQLELYNFLFSLGKTDSTSQIESIVAYKIRFTIKLAEKSAEYKKYYNLSSKLGFVIGLAFMIMVV